MTNRVVFARTADGSFNLAESRLGPAIERLFDGRAEPQIPAALMHSASRELVSAIHRFAAQRGCDFVQAARHVVAERPNLFKLTRCTAVAGNADADVEDESP